jgi:TRAP-type C4-dicarboxylate transport system substrate-binding protein
MAAQAIEKEIARYVHQLNTDQKKVVLNVAKTFAAEKKDWWDEMNKEQLSAIREAEAELDAGKGIPHAEVMKKLQKWL